MLMPHNNYRRSVAFAYVLQWRRQDLHAILSLRTRCLPRLLQHVILLNHQPYDRTESRVICTVPNSRMDNCPDDSIETLSLFLSLKYGKRMAFQAGEGAFSGNR